MDDKGSMGVKLAVVEQKVENVDSRVDSIEKYIPRILQTETDSLLQKQKQEFMCGMIKEIKSELGPGGAIHTEIVTIKKQLEEFQKDKSFNKGSIKTLVALTTIIAFIVEGIIQFISNGWHLQ